MKQSFKTACGYIRVSTDKQEELSPDAQKRLLLDYCKKNNLSILNQHIFIENGISGKKADKRPEFQKMIGMAKSKEHPFDVILVWKFSRFARNQEESIVYKSLLKKNNVEVVSVSEPLIDGPFGSLIERIIEWMDEYYSIRLAGEVIRGMSEKAMRGGYQSTLPLGYSMNKVTGIPDINPEEAEVVKLIFSKYVSGMTGLEICRELNTLGYRTKKGKMFEYRTINYILQNPFYVGKVRWNRQKHDDHTIRDKSEWIIAPGKHEPLFSEEYFNNVQQLVLKRSRPYRAHSAAGVRFWLSGLIKCSDCGSSLMFKQSYFQCGGYIKGSCIHSHYATVKKMEEAVYQGFRDVISSKTMNFIIKSESKDNLEDTGLIVTAQLNKLADKEYRIKQAYRDGIDTIEEYKENKELLNEERTRLQNMLKNSVKADDSSTAMLKEITTVYDIISNQDNDMRVRMNAIRSVVDHMIYDKEKDELKIFFYLAETR